MESKRGKDSGTVYIKRQRQCSDNFALTLAILFSLKTIVSLKNGLQPHPGVTPIVFKEQNC